MKIAEKLNVGVGTVLISYQGEWRGAHSSQLMLTFITLDHSRSQRRGTS